MMACAKLPPTHPTEEKEISAAIGLLSKWVNRNPMSAREVVKLSKACGGLPPTRKEGERWRTGLRQLLKEVRTEPDQESLWPNRNLIWTD
jgi:hypothetical protein